MLVFPTFVPSTLVLSYAGIRIRGTYDFADYHPFQTLGGSYRQLTGTGALDLSKTIIEDYLAFRFSATGSIATGLNPSTLVGDGAVLSGGFDAGFTAGVWTSPARSSRIGVLILAGNRNGYTLVAGRALGAINQNPIERPVGDAAGIIGSAAGLIGVELRESRVRLDVMWTYAVPDLFVSLQAAAGVEHSRRYLRTPNSPPGNELRGLDIEQSLLPRIGLATELDLGRIPALTDLPFAFMVEYQLSANHLWLRNAGADSAVFSRRPEQLVAMSLHYASSEHANLDAAVAVFHHWNLPPAASFAAGPGLDGPRPLQWGGEITAKYIW